MKSNLLLLFKKDNFFLESISKGKKKNSQLKLIDAKKNKIVTKKQNKAAKRTNI